MPAADPVTIRYAEPADAANLAALAIQIWLQTYAKDGIRDTLSDYVLSHYTPERMAEYISDPDRRLLVAERAAHLVGYSQLHLAAACPSDTTARAEMETLYVQAHFHGGGIGAALLEAALAQCQEAGHGRLWLTVFHGNERAIRFYHNHGFREIGTDDFIVGDERHKNLVLIRRAAAF